MATITDTTTDANGNIIINVSSSAEDAITLATAGTYSDKNIIFNIKTPQSTVQPDWNQNDSTAPGYVKNRPFYTGDSVETALVKEITVPFADEGGKYTGYLESTFVPTAGETYKVSWDGTAYENTCVNFNRLSVIGNLSLVGVGSDTGEPFLVASDGGGIMIATADTSASHTISISRYIESVVKINPKYLPMASKTEPGIIALDNLDNNVLRLVKKEYFTPTDFQVSGYGDANTIEECANRNNSYGIYIPGKSGGAVLSCYKNSVNKYITSVLSGGEYINCYKFSQGSLSGEQLWGISKDGVVISSSTANSTKKFKITVDDSGKPTFTNSSDSTDSYTPTDLPPVTSSDLGKFLRVSSAGEWVAETIPNASGVSF